MIGFSILLVYWAWILFWTIVFGTFHTIGVLHRARRRKPGPDLDRPPISILKPLAGIDVGLEKNLESFFQFDYPKYEIIFSVHSITDPAVDTAKRVMAKYPAIPARLIVSGPCRQARNPKVINTAPAFELAQYEWVFMADSTLRLAPDFLTRCAMYFSPETGSVSAVVTTASAAGLGGRLEHVLMNTFNVRALYLGRYLKLPFVWGKAVLFRRSVVESFGGVRSLENYLAEDFVLGTRIQRAGYKTVMMDEPALEYAWASTFMDYWKRQLRWGRTRRFFSLTLAMLTPFGSSLVSGLIGAWALKSLFGIPFGISLASHYAIWFACDVWLFKELGQTYSLEAFGAWVLRELLDVPLWFATMMGSTVEWKGQKFLILGEDTRLVPAPGDENRRAIAKTLDSTLVECGPTSS